MVKKMLPSGHMCRKCLHVEQMLRNDGIADHIHSVLYTGNGGKADQLATRFQISTAPFFVVHQHDGGVTAFQSYLRFRRDIFGLRATRDDGENEALHEI